MIEHLFGPVCSNFSSNYPQTRANIRSFKNGFLHFSTKLVLVKINLKGGLGARGGYNERPGFSRNHHYSNLGNNNIITLIIPNNRTSS